MPAITVAEYTEYLQEGIQDNKEEVRILMEMIEELKRDIQTAEEEHERNPPEEEDFAVEYPQPKELSWYNREHSYSVCVPEAPVRRGKWQMPEAFCLRVFNDGEVEEHCEERKHEYSIAVVRNPHRQGRWCMPSVFRLPIFGGNAEKAEKGKQSTIKSPKPVSVGSATKKSVRFAVPLEQPATTTVPQKQSAGLKPATPTAGKMATKQVQTVVKKIRSVVAAVKQTAYKPKILADRKQWRY